ncbi:hypothetical protein KIN20_008567 [Parelaphostrongylus tenuis]|uniref:RING-type E3 ubiquitin transferase (cysteine targeting) n=1 Tax=Parelaphostrongylus tenuis TaxID=148309 RepID=A0AAD5M839_PARTN|nr:hypothetical protein KIN20_008567 [Parelaphostrongylus tenuis]
MACESLRTVQVDANILDREYRQLISQQIERLTAELPISVARLCDLFRPEIRMLLDGVVWTTRISKGASPGQMEMGILYKDYSHKKICLHFLLSVLVPYFIKRFRSMFTQSVAVRTLSKISALFETASILHYLYFLRAGGHSTLVESFLGLRNWNLRRPTIGTVNYESQNRELLWHTFRDALLLVWPAYIAVSARLAGARRAEAETDGVALRCGHCGGIAVVPMRSASCGHVACYWCVKSRAPTELKKCVVCGEEENRIEPVVKGTLLLSGKAGDMQDERRRSSR